MQKQNGTEINILLPVTEFKEVLLVAERKKAVRAVVVAVVVAAVVVVVCSRCRCRSRSRSRSHYS
mgnify:CR=1 FL=1